MTIPVTPEDHWSSTCTSAIAAVVSLRQASLTESVPLQVGFELKVFLLLGWLPPQNKIPHSALVFNPKLEENGFMMFSSGFWRKQNQPKFEHRTPGSLSTSLTVPLSAPPTLLSHKGKKIYNLKNMKFSVLRQFVYQAKYLNLSDKEKTNYQERKYAKNIDIDSKIN